jgi:hypothetical protein
MKKSRFLKIWSLAFVEQFKTFTNMLDSSGVFWITRPSQMGCRDPRYAYILGLARTIRTELGVEFVTCEADDFNSSINIIVNVFDKFHLRGKDGVMDPGYEYIINGGASYVNRFPPSHLTTNQPRLLSTTKSSSLSTGLGESKP